jgi:hypothetical protein
LSYNSYFLAFFFSRNSIVLSQQISEQFFLAMTFQQIERASNSTISSTGGTRGLTEAKAPLWSEIFLNNPASTIVVVDIPKKRSFEPSLTLVLAP